MDLQFRFHESALKHGVTEADIRHAFENYRTIRQFQDRENVYLLIGFDLKANPIEIWESLKTSVFRDLPLKNARFAAQRARNSKGTSKNNRFLEVPILYIEFGENSVNVFHAMACQSRFLWLLEEGKII